MCSQAFFKRIIPFVVTFVLGLFVASFFVSIAPNFKFRRDFRRNEVRQLRYEKQQLEMEKQILKQRLEESEKRVLLEAPLPPPPPTIRIQEMPKVAVKVEDVKIQEVPKVTVEVQEIRVPAKAK